MPTSVAVIASNTLSSQGPPTNEWAGILQQHRRELLALEILAMQAAIHHYAHKLTALVMTSVFLAHSPRLGV